VTSLLAVFEAAIREKSTRMIKTCLKTNKKIKYGNSRYLLHKSPSKISVRHRIHSLLRQADARGFRADARGSTDIIYRINVTHIASMRVRHSY